MRCVAYALRSLDTGEYMPEMRNHRGYSHWSPKVGRSTPKLARETGLPRLFPDIRSATIGRTSWAMGMFTHEHVVPDPVEDPYGESRLVALDMGRKVSDLQIVEVSIYCTATDESAG